MKLQVWIKLSMFMKIIFIRTCVGGNE
jgi:hypothetical protein